MWLLNNSKCVLQWESRNCDHVLWSVKLPTHGTCPLSLHNIMPCGFRTWSYIFAAKWLPQVTQIHSSCMKNHSYSNQGNIMQQLRGISHSNPQNEMCNKEENCHMTMAVHPKWKWHFQRLKWRSKKGTQVHCLINFIQVKTYCVKLQSAQLSLVQREFSWPNANATELGALIWHIILWGWITLKYMWILVQVQCNRC